VFSAGFLIGGVAAVFVYKEVTQHPYQRLPQGDETEGDSYDNIRRASTVEMLRRRPAAVGEHGGGGSGNLSGAEGSAYSTGSTVGRYENVGRFDGQDRGIAPSAASGTPTVTGGRYGSSGSYQHEGADNL
jgi:hypothetical protein